ncbi:DNA repair protein RecN [Pelagicoccus sp. SDUM812005]|uniref:DNA repair protein RecN n=1 Tax=Pelagicoccus sp. SDUM812005 TaxID=3041257 RepID=UPI00280C8EF9|nr:DNA repair protein RecN [Pelagicoccus sp. SDUM812005]MDQ8179445.1 DNA repair protein RecN [Pelagicoccus sp. SDUM812005]
MLQYLKIANLALLESASIDFESGFTVVTGETGAGKSVLLGALSLLSGARTDKSVIRSGTELCEVEAALWFEDSQPIDALLEGMNLPACEEGMLVLKRSLHVSKPSRISINGSFATLSNLQELGEMWIDFHGPGEPQRLLKSECQLELIDLYGGLEKEAQEYGKRYRAWRSILGEIEELQGASQLAPDQIDFIKSQLRMIDALELSPESIEQLEQDFNRVSGAQELLELTAELSNGLSGDEGALNLISQLSRAAEQAAELDPSLSDLAERLNGLIIETQELGAEYEQLGSSLEFEPEYAQEVTQKMNDWQDLRRKYGRDVNAVLAARDEMEKRLESQGDIQGSLERLHAEADKIEAELKGLASRLTQKRLKAGKSLAQKAEKMLLELGFKKGRFGIQMLDQTNLKSHGDSLPDLLFSPNVGEPMKSLSDVASSGELARVMLALKTILADVDSVPVLVFDEVDANVGGEIGRIVGQKLKGIGDNHQVICITHLPQVAALGKQHFLVEKDQSGDRAAVKIRRMDTESEGRVEELARMLGDRQAKSALSHARELLAL